MKPKEAATLKQGDLVSFRWYAVWRCLGLRKTYPLLEDPMVFYKTVKRKSEGDQVTEEKRVDHVIFTIEYRGLPSDFSCSFFNPETDS